MSSYSDTSPLVIIMETEVDSTNFTYWNETKEFDWRWTPITWSWWIILQLLMALLGIVGNLLVMIVLFFRRSSRNPTDILIGGLAAADFLTSIFMIPLPKLSGAPNTALGYAACKLIYSSIFLWVSISASIFTLTAIAIERYIAVIHAVNFKRWVTPRRVNIWFIIIWLLAIAINSRTFGTTIVDSEKGKCLVRYPYYGVQVFSGILVFLSQFIIPTIIMLSAYSLIARSLHIRSKRFSPKDGIKRNRDKSGTSSENRLSAARVKVIKLMFVVIVTFIVCWVADSVALLAYNLHLVERSYLYSNTYHVLVVMAFFNTCANPLIYAIHYGEFRTAVRDLCACSHRVQKASLFGKDGLQMTDREQTEQLNTVV